jgi:deoxyribodipyrimidine photo-lyase
MLVRSGPMLEVLQTLRREFPFTHLFSHEETGSGWSHARDLAVARWCRSAGVQLTETPHNGVVPLGPAHEWAASTGRRRLQGGAWPGAFGRAHAARPIDAASDDPAAKP